MGYSVLDFRRRRASGAFLAIRLFAGGGLGLLYNSSDLSTLFQDSPGTTPVTTAGQSNGLTLDKSRGLVLGAELITNGDGASAVGWSGARGSETVTATGGRIRATSNNGSTMGVVQELTGLTAGGFYKVKEDGFNSTSGSILLRLQPSSTLGAGENLAVGSSGSDASFDGYATAEDETLYIGAIAASISAGEFIEIDNISFRELPGNHAKQPSTSFQSKYQTGPDRKVYDGFDDRDETTLKPTTAGTLAVRMRSNTASKVAIGSQPSSNGRCYIGLASDGSLAGGIGTQATSVIKGSTDVRTAWVTGILTWDGSTVTLYQDGVSVYSAAQSGAVNTTTDFTLGALNNNGTAAAFHAGDIARALVLNRAITTTEVTDLSTLWGTIS